MGKPQWIQSNEIVCWQNFSFNDFFMMECYQILTSKVWFGPIQWIFHGINGIYSGNWYTPSQHSKVNCFYRSQCSYKTFVLLVIL